MGKKAVIISSLILLLIIFRVMVQQAWHERVKKIIIFFFIQSESLVLHGKIRIATSKTFFLVQQWLYLNQLLLLWQPQLQCILLPGQYHAALCLSGTTGSAQTNPNSYV